MLKNRNLKKVFVLLLTVALLAGMAVSAGAETVTLKILTWTNQANLAALNAISEAFMAKYPGVVVEITDVPASEYDQLCTTRISAQDADIITRSGLRLPTPEWAKGAEQSIEYQWIEAGVFEDLTAQPFAALYPANVLAEAASYEGKVYGIPTGIVAFTGAFYNKDIFQKYGLSVPTVWSEFEKVCTTLKDNGVTPMTIGQADGWPRALPEEAVQDAMMGPDTHECVRKLWAGELKYTDPWGVAMYDRWLKILSWFDPNFTATPYDAVPGIFAAGQVAMLPDGIWQAPAILETNPDINMGYFPLPVSDDAANNSILRGKYDLTLFVTTFSPQKQAALDWISFFSEKENYTGYCNATGFVPTQEGIQVDSAFINNEIMPHLSTFKLAIEKTSFAPNGMSNEYSLDNCSPMGNLTDPAVAAAGEQKAFEDALAAIK